MKNSKSTLVRKGRRKLRLESLEQRNLMASFGTPWPDPRSLTVSFPTENAQIGGYNNSIRTVLDQVTDRKVWQTETLRAFQTWAVESNINIGLMEDRGDHFGAVGLTQNDPRFGDFRIGAFPQTGVLANALPFQTNAGSWAGDVLLNTQTNFFLGDWASGSPITAPPADSSGPSVELFSVLLHEAGNALGLADVNRPGTVMHQSYGGPMGRLTSTDRTAIRLLYGGPRRDIYEPVANNVRTTATLINQSAAQGGRVPIFRQGSLNTAQDVDFYQLTPLATNEKLTVRLRAEGISLVKATLAVMDQNGNVIADVKADSILDNNLQLEIGSLPSYSRLFIRVAANGNDVFSVGDYQLELDYRPQSQQPVDKPLIYDADAVDEDSKRVFNPAETVDQIFAKAGLIDNEIGRNDTRGTATRLTTALGHLSGTRYETIGSLTSQDTDFLVFRSPTSRSTAMSIRVETLGTAKPTIHADVFDQVGNRVRAIATPASDGSITFVVQNPTPNADYSLQIRAAAKPIQTGNYVATVDFATDTVQAGEVISTGTVTANQKSWTRFEVYKTQLFRTVLSATSTSANSGVRLTIYDAKRANVVFTTTTSAGLSEIDFFWLQRGVYVVLAEAIGRGIVPSPVNFKLTAQGISDDQGPLPIDPSDPYGGTDPTWVDPYGGVDPWVSPIPDPYGGELPFPDPSSSGGAPPYEPPTELEPWWEDPYYYYYYG